MANNNTRPAIGRLVLLRHGQSDWNQKNLFTGWTDVDLTAQGRDEAHQAGRTLAAAGVTFDVAFTSVLVRAVRTLWIVLDEMKLMWIPVERSWRLNERHYGSLQGLDKAQTTAPTRSLVSIDDVVAATAFLALDGAKLITGGVMYIDGGYHIMD